MLAEGKALPPVSCLAIELALPVKYDVVEGRLSQRVGPYLIKLYKEPSPGDDDDAVYPLVVLLRCCLLVVSITRREIVSLVGVGV